ncbi:hypothetical protein PWT90_00158 [Aphanocladium album]|nr:hypothetical protein PWT90_00158 [Aphanocladium album]
MQMVPSSPSHPSSTLSMAISTTAVVFAYHNVGVSCLQVLLARGICVPLVVTLEDDPDENIWFGSVIEVCKAHDIPYITGQSWPKVLQRLQEIKPSYIFSFYYRYMIPDNVLEQATKGAYNMHGSLLPKYRGRVPVNWAVLHGEMETGVTLHEMVTKPDAGPIIAQTSVPILPDDTAFQVFGKLTVAAEQTLWGVLPRMLRGEVQSVPNDISKGTYFGRRRPEDGEIDWSQPAQKVYNLHRAVAPPYPGAWTVVNGRKLVIGKARLAGTRSSNPGLAVINGQILGVCGDGHCIRILELLGDGVVTPEALQEILEPVQYPKHVLILGVNGFIGHHLLRRILGTTDWFVSGIDISSHRIEGLLSHSRLRFCHGDIQKQEAWIREQAAKCDIIIPLVAIATPSVYVKDPLRVFKLDFEANLVIVRLAAEFKKRLVFPSTSEVYGMCKDETFGMSSNLVCGPVNKPRWIYSSSKQLLERVILAHGLDFTIIRPFNWIGSRLDSLHATAAGSSRVTTQFLGHIIRGEDITLVDGGSQTRTFLHIDDGIAALMKILENRDGVATGKIYNIGSPENNTSIKELAEAMLQEASKRAWPKVAVVSGTSKAYYGEGYQDVKRRMPDIVETCKDLDWAPTVGIRDALSRLFDSYEQDAGGW